MHKKMLDVSGRVHRTLAVRPPKNRDSAPPPLFGISGADNPTMPTGTGFSAAFTCAISARPSMGT